MTLAALIRKRETGTPANANPANSANDGQGKAGTLATLATLALANPQTPEDAPPADLALEARRERVLAMLDGRTDTRYAVLVDNPDTDPVLLTLAIRGQATCDLTIPAAKFDVFKLMDLIDRHGQTVH